MLKSRLSMYLYIHGYSVLTTSLCNVTSTLYVHVMNTAFVFCNHGNDNRFCLWYVHVMGTIIINCTVVHTLAKCIIHLVLDSSKIQEFLEEYMQHLLLGKVEDCLCFLDMNLDPPQCTSSLHQVQVHVWQWSVWQHVYCIATTIRIITIFIYV